MILSEREVDVMNVLWRRGSATVSEVLDELQDELAYTTVLTILQRLEDKGHVGHRSEGKAHRYLPILERGAVQDSALERMTRKLFAGSPKLLVTRLLGEGELTRDQLRELRALVDERLEERGEG
jgi:BlaI family transcriptional regulator, penicillinase repressor